MVSLESLLGYQYIFIMITALGYFTAVLQKILTYWLKDNVEIPRG